MNETISIALEHELLPLVNKRAKELDLNRSQYLRRLVREDLAAQPPKPPRRKVKKKEVAS